jgi:serine/threonine protein kinase/Tfp pilus assembly protein PilF
MTDARWTRLERIYHAAVGLPVADRTPFVRREAGDDIELATEVEALLAYDDRPAAFTRHSAMELAARALAGRQQLREPERCSGPVGAYEIVRSIGSGGMGDVYLAHDRRLARDVALKVLRSGPQDLDWIAAFRHEALAASALNHPNILTIYEIGEHDGTRFIASEYVDGVTLRERLKGGRLPLLDLVGIALQIAEGLAAAHKAGVVHRDIKPDNVMLRADGLVKILDFGIATRTVPDLVPVLPEPAEGNGVVIGTTGYMSPEQSRGRPVDATTDVWSLGVVIHEMATGRVPAWLVRTDSATSRQGCIGPPLDELALLPPELLPIVTRALSIDRADRYATAGALAVELRALSRTLDGRLDRAPGSDEQTGPHATAGTRRRWLIGAAATIVIAAMTYLVAVTPRVPEPRAPSSVGVLPPENSEETRDPAAYQLYAKGRYHVLKRTPDDLRRGLSYLREAVTLDPSYGRAYARLADGYILLAMTGDVAPREAFPRARTAAERALAIDSGLSEARVSMGIIKFWFDWDWSGAEAEFKRAIASHQSDPAAHMFYGHLLSNLGDHTGALQEMRRALDYQRHSALANALFAQCLYYQGRYDESLAHLRTTIDLDPSLWLTHNMTGRIYGLKGMTREALDSFNRASELGGSLVVRANAGYTLAASGRREEARAVLEELKARAGQAYVPPSNLALVHLGLGEYDAALDRLEEAVDARDMLVTFLTVEPRWAALAGQPRFSTLLGAIGLRQ